MKLSKQKRDPTRLALLRSRVGSMNAHN